MLFAGVLGVAWVLHQRHALDQWWRDRRAVLVVVLLVSVGAAGAALFRAGGLDTLRRFGAEADLLRVGPHGGKIRMLEHQVALKMFNDRPWFGWGAGSYLYNYAGYDAAVPEMASNRSGYSYYLLNPHADGDWYEFLAEFGIIGTLLFLFIWLPHLIWWVRMRAWAGPAVCMPALAVGLVLGHGFIDSVFRNLALFLVLGVSTALVTKSLNLRDRSEEVPGDRRQHAVPVTMSSAVRQTTGRSASRRERRWW
jgi:O-antigen ligase